MLIAHHGDKTHQPENTIAAFEAAHNLGACAIQCDVRFSMDGTPWCFHDDTLHIPGSSKTHAFHTLKDSQLHHQSINRFIELVDWASCHRHLDWFIGVSPANIASIGFVAAVEKMMGLMRSENDSFALLTDDCSSLRAARNMGWHRVALEIGCVSRCLSADIVTLAPEYLLIRDSQVECEELPPGPWQWVVYEINSTEDAVLWRKRGAHHVLTGNLPLLMRSREASDVYGF
ncbi:glycerophosphodiester phosphodiesterase [Microbulbifer sp. OS29]|uniref:Glycerophosphodiester phosphodiesterase n=1 Tax=Microbulbifer okhotskensis TaxID=2926617 RepID=A0A9X2J5M3_9GAMM|nr:glycerophosphodiester phosphodiesterase family protein [Microbulbifer okhotskensis]MCO1335697.1 glycerophosphodiester phosphodiesterase [Microbulbifer okhotskensis]